jgi:hypothetical protein
LKKILLLSKKNHNFFLKRLKNMIIWASQVKYYY